MWSHKSIANHWKRAHKTEHHNVLGKGIRNSQESCTVPVYVPPVDTLPVHVPNSY